MSTNERDIALVPPEVAEPRIRKAPGKAGGIPAVTSALGHAFRKVGIIKGPRTLLRVNQTDGFDCPGCAWPDPAHRSTFEFCENGAKAVADEAMKAGVDADFFARHAISELGGWSDFDLNRAGRIARPMVLRKGMAHYEPIEWAEAFELVGNHLTGLAHPNEAIFYTSGRTSNEAAFLYQLFVRAFGTNNMPDCSNMCHESSGVGLTETIGIGKGTVRLEDFEHCDAIFVLGQNPGTNHPRMLSALQQAKRRGAAIVTLNPLREAGLVAFVHPQEAAALVGKGTTLTDLHLQVRVNGDVAALQGIMKAMLAAEAAAPGTVLDQAFIASRTIGFETFRNAIEACTWEELEAGSGLSRTEMEAAAAIACRSRAIIACWAMGLTQHRNAVDNVREVVNFLLLGGHFGRPGAGACPVRGHSNVQGDRTVGITEKPSPAFLESLERHFGISVPRDHGYSTVHAIHAMKRGDAKVFVGLGGNFLSASPDTAVTAEALRKCELTVHVATKLNRSHLVHGQTALLLPCLGRTEIHQTPHGPQFVSVENSMGVVHASRGHNRPASPHLLSEPAIIAGLAQATLPSSPIPWQILADDLDQTRNAIEACVHGFNDYNQRVRQPLGFELPNAPREGRFATVDALARFSVNPLPVHGLRAGQFLMMTIRSHDQYNTTVYGLDDRYRGVRGGRRVVLMHPDDRAAMGFRSGQKVAIVSHFRGESRRAPDFVVVDHAIARGAVATYFPEANVLVPLDSFADRSFTPTSKSVVVTLHGDS